MIRLLYRYRTRHQIIRYDYRNRPPAMQVTIRRMERVNSIRIMVCHFRQAITQATFMAANVRQDLINLGREIILISMSLCVFYSGWWHNNCDNVAPNGKYQFPIAFGMIWRNQHITAADPNMVVIPKECEMKIKRL